jgi:HSP20 family protein
MFSMSRRSDGDAGSQLLSARNDFNRLFEQFFRDWGVSPWMTTEPTTMFVPKLDMRETPETVEVTAELPGMTTADIDLTVQDNYLVLRGEKKTEHDETKGNFHRVERTYGRFERAVPLPAEVDVEKTNADFKNGVLTVTLPKSKKAKEAQKKIAIKA